MDEEKNQRIVVGVPKAKNIFFTESVSNAKVYTNLHHLRILPVFS